MKRIANIIILLTISVVGFSFTLITNPYPYNSEVQTKKVKSIQIPEDSHSTNILEREREVRKLEAFTEISVAIKANVFYMQGNENKVEIDADTEVLQYIITEVKKGDLVIRTKNNKDPKGEINIYITSIILNRVSISGSANFIAEGKVKAKEFEIQVAGSGDVKFNDLEANEVTAEVAGSGDIIIESTKKANELTINIAGSGDVNAKKFEVKEAEVNIAGSGDCIVFVTNELEVNVAGSGDVIYLGNPEIETNIIGSGEVRRQ